MILKDFRTYLKVLIDIALIIKIPELLKIIFAKNNCARRKKIVCLSSLHRKMVK
jgi:hypothetical protein